MNSYGTIVHQLQRQQKFETNHTIKFRTGQIFSGKIETIFPDHHAILRIGGQKVVAKLDAPIDIDTTHWFQVISTDNKVQLKVLPTIQSRENLLAYFHLPVNKAMNSFIDLWQKENLPLEKNLLMTASGWLKGHDVEKVLDTVKLILKLNLPMTEEVFHGLYSLNNGKSFSNLLDQFFHYLNQNQLKQDAIMNKIQVFLEKTVTV